MSAMPDALSSASLLLAAIALVYAAWSPLIEDEAKRVYSTEPNTKQDQQRETKKVLRYRARPLMFASWLVFAVFLPRCVEILATIAACATAHDAQCSYDDVAAIFLLTQVVLAGLALHLGGRVGTLKAQITS